MGDRANVQIHDKDFGDVYLYTHWSGSELPAIVQKALARKQRWEDASYLARIVFCEIVVESEWDAEAGYGISSVVGDEDDRVLTIDVDNQQVCWPDGAGLPIADFVALDDPTWTAPTGVVQKKPDLSLSDAAANVVRLLSDETVPESRFPHIAALNRAVAAAAVD